MATYYSDKITAGAQPRADIGITSVTGSFTIAVAPVTGDIFQMVKIPKGATVLEIVASASASVAGTAQLEVGDAGDDNRYLAGASAWTASGAGSVARMGTGALLTAFGYTYTADDIISIKALSITTGATAAVLTLTVIYTTDK
jgi:hypothetical protein